MNPESEACAPPVIAALVIVTQVFGELAAWLRGAAGFSDVVQQCLMTTQNRRDDGAMEIGVGEGLLIEWYADAEHEWGAGLSFCMSLTLDEREWTIESSVRGVGKDGEQVLLEFPTRYAIEDVELVRELWGAARMLRESPERALVEFGKHYGVR